MKIYKTILPFLYTLLLYMATHAQTPTLPGYTWQSFGAADGLLSSEVLSLYQDAKDFIWMGTRSGISRYDGKRFQNFEYVGNKRIGAVYQITEDSESTLWISSETGLYYWQEKSFAHYAFKDEANYLPFTSIYFTHTKEVWVGTAKGPAHLLSLKNEQPSLLETIVVKDWATVARDQRAVNYISSSKKGIVFGASSNVYLYQDGRLQKLPYPVESNSSIRNVFIDDKGFVYWNELLTGFYYWDGSKVKHPAGSDAFYLDIASKNGALYLYTNVGIKEVDGTTKKVTTVTDLEPLELRMPTCLLPDKEGAWWAGTTEGVFHIKKNEFTNHVDSRMPYTDDVYSLLRRRNGDLLLGANRGRIFTMSDNLQPYKKIPQVVPLAEVFSMFEDEEQSLWFGTGYQGIALFRNGRLRNFTKKNGLPDNTHNAFFKSSIGELWSAGDWGLTRITEVVKDSFSFQPFFYLDPVSFHKLYGIVEAPNGTIWTGGQLGLFYVEGNSLKRYSLPEIADQNILITAIKMDKHQNVWLATSGHGLLCCRFTKDNRLHLQQRWRTEAGLPANTYLSLAFDEKENIWAGSYTGVTALVPLNDSTFRIKNFDMQDGFINKNYQSLNLFADSNRMWACTSAGAVSFIPSALLQQSHKAPLYITAIDLLNTIKGASEFLIKDSKPEEPSYRFPSSINSFSIQFAALYYSNPGAIRYFYKLQGIDSSWTSTGSEQLILFRQLAAGSYKLLVKASIGGSDWTNTATLFFRIDKPWWSQWWLIASVAIVITILVLLAIKSRERSARQKEQQKTEFQKLKAASYQQQLEIEQVINYFATSLNGHTTIDSVLWDVARNCISQLGFEDCVIYIKSSDGNTLVQKAAWGPKTTEQNRIVNPIEIPLGNGIVGTVALTGKAEMLADTSKDSRYIVDDIRRASEIAVPIFDEGEVIGVIDSEHSQANFYTGRHLHILTTIASHCGAKISTLKAEEKTASARLESLLNKQKALEASLQSMRLQMNPHFLFNALNSIQQMILSGDETMATRFLSKFSKLLRTVLTNSNKEEISLKEEIELLQLYVELESLRFKESFSFFITCEEGIDTEEIRVPALFFQPMVENAIWHGLMHKTGTKELKIQFEEPSVSCLICRIEDNGVGRQAAYKNGNAQPHTGKGLSVAQSRLQALNEKNNTLNSLRVVDLKNEAGDPVGTKIEITLYYQ